MPSTQTFVKEDNGLFALWKGTSGGGKSTAAFSFPTPYVFDLDRKMPNIAMKHFPDKEIVWDTFTSVFKLVEKLDEFEKECPYETLILDSFTYLCQLVITSIDEVKGTNAAKLLNKLTKGKNGEAGTVEALGMDYYGAESRFSEYVMDRLKTLHVRNGNPRHVIVTAHVVTVEGKPNPMDKNSVSVTRGIVSKGNKVGAWLPTGFDNEWVIGQSRPDLATAVIDRQCVTAASGLDSAKCAYNLPEIIKFTGNSLEPPNLYKELQRYTGWA